MKILIEPHCIDMTQVALACGRLNLNYKSLDYKPFEGTDLTAVKSWLGNSPSVFFGSIGAARFLQRHLPQTTVIADFKRLRCQSYFPAFSQKLWNKTPIFVPFGLLRNNADCYFSIFKADELFIRPDDGIKSFTGMAAGRRTFERDLDYLIQCEQAKPDTLCVLAAERFPDKEYRLFVAGDEIVTGSQYKSAMKLEDDPVVPQHIIQYAKHVLKSVPLEQRPEPLFVMDVAEDNTGLGVVELNSFSCSGWYAASPQAIIQAAVDYVNRQEDES